ncbi:MAG: hypothetical protein D3910_04535 [Candidatus Electrothrix sp. ATG2]|nr:hypothetical protein [Candidatus Electrothrix sp. ATG2]
MEVFIRQEYFTGLRQTETTTWFLGTKPVNPRRKHLIFFNRKPTCAERLPYDTLHSVKYQRANCVQQKMTRRM